MCMNLKKNVYDVHGPITLLLRCDNVLNIQQLRSRCYAVCQFRANTLLHKANGRVQI